MGLATLFLAGCSHPAYPPSFVARPSNIIIAVALPQTPKQLTGTPFNVTLNQPTTGTPIRGADVTISLVMPSMLMPPNTFTCRESAPGYYQGVGTFTMIGNWRVDVQAVVPGKGLAKLSRAVAVK